MCVREVQHRSGDGISFFLVVGQLAIFDARVTLCPEHLAFDEDVAGDGGGGLADRGQAEVVHAPAVDYYLNSMNEYELTKVRRQLQRSQEVIEELRGDLKFTEEKLVAVTAERDKYHAEILITR